MFPKVLSVYVLRGPHKVVNVSEVLSLFGLHGPHRIVSVDAWVEVAGGNTLANTLKCMHACISAGA